jgi:hypothetical protein
MTPGADPYLANVFEDDSGIRRESGWLRRFTKLEMVREAEFIPGGYGVCWERWDSFEFVCAPQPWHLLLGAGYRLYHRLRRGFAFSDTVATQAYERGCADGTSRAAAGVRDNFQRRLSEAEVRAFEAGYRYAFDWLKAFADDDSPRQKGSLD